MWLPSELDTEQFDRSYRLDHGAWRSAIVEVARAHGLASDVVQPFADGSNLVARVDDRWVVKIFPPFHGHQWESERRALGRLQGEQLPLAVPKLLAQGVRADGWLYVVIEKLPGVGLDACWNEASATEREAMVERIGAMMAAVHALPLGSVAGLEPEWTSFLDEQKRGCRARHARFGAPAWFDAGLSALVQPIEDSGERVLLTGEYTPFNLLAERTDAGWQLTGMIDFGDAMVGPRDYDLLGPSMFTCRGDAALVRALFRGHDGGERGLDSPRRMRLMALAALHRYANFDAQLRIPSWSTRVGSFDELARLIWP